MMKNNSAYFKNIFHIGDMYLDHVFLNLNTSLLYLHVQILITVYIFAFVQKFVMFNDGL